MGVEVDHHCMPDHPCKLRYGSHFRRRPVSIRQRKTGRESGLSPYLQNPPHHLKYRRVVSLDQVVEAILHPSRESSGRQRHGRRHVLCPVREREIGSGPWFDGKAPVARYRVDNRHRHLTNSVEAPISVADEQY